MIPGSNLASAIFQKQRKPGGLFKFKLAAIHLSVVNFP